MASLPRPVPARLPVPRPGLPVGTALLVALVLLPSPLSGQVEAEPVLRGRVLLGDRPLDSATVTLHRVSPDAAGEIDSVRTGADGTFSLRLPAVPDPSAGSEVFFASTRYRDILYFGRPLTSAVQLDSLYRIQVHDTVLAPPGGVELPVEVRNVFLEPAGEGWRVTDLFQVRNEGDRTVVAAEGEPVWTYPLPPGARDFEVGQSDLSPDAVGFEGGALRVRAPAPPGERLYVIRYVLPGTEVALPLPGVTERVELLVREPAPPLSVSGLEALQPVELEPGTTYRRYSAVDLADAQVTVRAAEEEQGLPYRWLAVGLALLLGIAGIVAVLRPRVPAEAPAGAAAGPADARRGLLLEIARLDETFEARDDPSEEEHRRYRRRRAELVSRLRSRDAG